MQRQFPIREQRKAETREKLILAAQQLFMEKGYEATTLEGVAKRAGLHVQTLYRHFKTKVELAAAGDEQQLSDFSEAIKSKSKDVSTIDFWKEYVSEVARTLTNKDETEARYREVLHEEIKSPVTAKIFMQLGQAYQELLAKSLASDLKIRNQKECEEAARLIAITLWGAHADMMRRYDNDRNLNLQAEVIATIERVESFCRPLFKSYR